MTRDFANGILYCLMAFCLIDATRAALMWWHEHRENKRAERSRMERPREP